jgi:hypothetical protein
LDKKRSTEDDVRDSCIRHFKDDPAPHKAQDLTVHLLLDSRGGSLDSAFKTALFLRRFAGNIRVYVPRRAKSAGTLIAIGSDKIVMSPFAELGPLDSQIQDPRNPTKNVSALDLYQSVDYVREFGLGKTLPIALKTLFDATDKRVPLLQLLTVANDFALGSTTPILGQVQPLDFGSWGRTLKIGETYAKSLLTRLQDSELRESAGRIARRLVYDYTHHLYPIDLDEADRIGLKPETMERSVYLAAMRVIDACGDCRCVGFAGDPLGDQEPLTKNHSQPGEEHQSTTKGVDVDTANPSGLVAQPVDHANPSGGH